MTVHRGGCHCGRIAFRVSGEIEGAEICNCSICHMKGYVHWYVTPDRFELLTPEGDYSTYRFNTRVARHCISARSAESRPSTSRARTRIRSM